MDALMRRLRHARGQTMVEYGLLLAGIAIVAIAGVLVLGPAVRDLFGTPTAAISGIVTTRDPAPLTPPAPPTGDEAEDDNGNGNGNNGNGLGNGGGDGSNGQGGGVGNTR